MDIKNLLRQMSFYEHVLLRTNSYDKEALETVSLYHVDAADKIMEKPQVKKLNHVSIRYIADVLTQQSKAYKVNGELVAALDKKANIKLSTDLFLSKMIQDKAYVIEVPFSERAQIGQYYLKTLLASLCYVEKGDLFMMILVLPVYSTADDMLRIDDEYKSIEHNYAFLEVKKGGTFSELLNDQELRKHLNNKNADFVYKCLKCLFYILSGGNPDLREIPGEPIRTKKAKKAKRKLHERPVFDAIAVGMGFEKSPLYTKDSWEYLRWQPYGRRSMPDYKLIKITARRRKELLND